MVAAGAEPALGVRITSIDQEYGARLATRHLLELGHRNIGHIAGPSGWFDAIERVRGWQGELADHGIRPGPQVIGDWTAASGHRAAGRLLRRKKVPTAVFVANDLMAVGVLRAMHDAGVRVPHDISIVGFDDMPGAGHLIPGLTTVRQDMDRLGGQCIAMLLAALNGSTGRFAPLEPELVVRESAAPFAG
jgi:DNA-binding LacI/PurR family transcriptional regulator